MLPSRCAQLPCMNIAVSAVSGQPCPTVRAGALDLARLEGQRVDGALQVGELVEHPDEDVRRDQRDRDERERPRRHVVAERQHAAMRIPLESGAWLPSRTV